MSNLVTIPTSRVREILAINRNGGKVDSILGEEAESQVEEPTYRTEEDSITRFDKAKKSRKKKNRNRHNSDENKASETTPNEPKEAQKVEQKGEQKSEQKGEQKGHNGHRHHKHRHHNKPKQE
jgi:hypothetical protein